MNADDFKNLKLEFLKNKESVASARLELESKVGELERELNKK